MAFGRKLEELNMTTEEINRFSKAMKDKKFSELLHEYAQEISNPENKKKYEEEITQLEQERGMEVKFIHPNAHHVLKTSVNGKEKCFINICSNNLISKPSCEARRNETGRAGQYWSLPYSLTPGRPHTDGKGNKCMIYDVVFHPDTLYMASKNPRFMKLVNDTATQGVEDAFNVTTDKTNTLLKKTRYKGVPQAAVIRKPIPGQPKNEESTAHHEAFPILYPDTMPTKDFKSLSSSQTQTTTIQSSSLPTQPHYTIKYRSLVDLQDYRCSRDSAPKTRPKEIVISVYLPLLKSAVDVDLNVMDRKLTLESQKPDYKLELHLSYPVDDNKGVAQFNTTTKQLTVTLPVQPAENPAEVRVESIKPEPEDRDVLESSDKANKETLKDEPSELNISDSSCEAQPQEKGKDDDTLFSSDEIQNCKMDCLESKLNGLHLAKAEETLPYPINTETHRTSENVMNVPKKGFLLNACTQKTSLKFHANKEAENNQDKENLPSGTKSNQPSNMESSETCENCTLEIPVVELQTKQAASQLEETLHDVQSSPADPSSWVTMRSEVQPSAISDGPNQLNSPLDKDTRKTSCRGEEMLASSEQKSSSKLISTRVAQNEKVDDVDSSKQNEADFSISSSPDILLEKNPEDGSEVIISDHTTSAALCFQNSLWFELE